MPLLGAFGLARVNPQVRNPRALISRDLDATAKAERPQGWKTRPIADTIAETAQTVTVQRALRAASRNFRCGSSITSPTVRPSGRPCQTAPLSTRK
ncbi:hypothetical protein Aab01nite_48180 [Paractinoplanes abujensis]|nr:hypothetical protein Aab01nite_48180 [Actinoplanes abujensis]